MRVYKSACVCVCACLSACVCVCDERVFSNVYVNASETDFI